MFPAVLLATAMPAFTPQPRLIPSDMVRSGLVIPPPPPKINFPTVEELDKAELKSLDKQIASVEADLRKAHQDMFSPKTIRLIEAHLGSLRERKTRIESRKDKPFNLDEAIQEFEIALAKMKKDKETPKEKLDLAQQTLEKARELKKQLEAIRKGGSLGEDR